MRVVRPRSGTVPRQRRDACTHVGVRRDDVPELPMLPQRADPHRVLLPTCTHWGRRRGWPRQERARLPQRRRAVAAAAAAACGHERGERQPFYAQHRERPRQDAAGGEGGTSSGRRRRMALRRGRPMWGERSRAAMQRSGSRCDSSMKQISDTHVAHSSALHRACATARAQNGGGCAGARGLGISDRDRGRRAGSAGVRAGRARGRTRPPAPPGPPCPFAPATPCRKRPGLQRWRPTCATASASAA